MSSYAAEGSRRNKRQKKEESPTPSSSSCMLMSLPYDVALNCLFRLSRLDSATLSLVSKSHRSLVVSSELCRKRSVMRCTEEFYYVCLSIHPNPIPRWCIFRRGGKTLDNATAKKTVNRRLRPIPSHSYQPLESSSFVVLDYGIYIIGGIINGNPTTQVLLFDCLSHTWLPVPSMRVARASAAANVVDGKIYVFGGCEEDVDSSNWGEVFDPKTQTWDALQIPEDPEICKNTRMFDKCVVIDDKIYAVDEEKQSLCYLPREGIWRRGNQDSKRGTRNDWCAIGNLLYCRGTRGKILWCEPDELDWKEVKGLDILDWGTFAYKVNRDECFTRKFQMTQMGFSRLSSNSRGNIVVFWRVHIWDTKWLELWCAEISLERREGGEIWGKIEWANAVSTLNPLSYSVKVLYSVSLNV